MFLCHVFRAGVCNSDVDEGAMNNELLIEEIQNATGYDDIALKYCPDEGTTHIEYDPEKRDSCDTSFCSASVSNALNGREMIK